MFFGAGGGRHVHSAGSSRIRFCLGSLLAGSSIKYFVASDIGIMIRNPLKSVILMVAIPSAPSFSTLQTQPCHWAFGFE